MSLNALYSMAAQYRLMQAINFAEIECLANQLVFTILQVHIAALNDSRLIGLCLYNVVILCGVGITLTLVLEDKVAMLYGISSAILIIGTSGTQLVIFIPKVPLSMLFSGMTIWSNAYFVCLFCSVKIELLSYIMKAKRG